MCFEIVEQLNQTGLWHNRTVSFRVDHLSSSATTKPSCHLDYVCHFQSRHPPVLFDQAAL
jgi:hypothetical protein